MTAIAWSVYGMIKASKAGFLFRSTDEIKKEYPELPAFETYDELMAGVKIKIFILLCCLVYEIQKY